MSDSSQFMSGSTNGRRCGTANDRLLRGEVKQESAGSAHETANEMTRDALTTREQGGEAGGEEGGGGGGAGGW